MRNILCMLAIPAMMAAASSSPVQAQPNGYLGEIQPYPYTFCPRGTMEATGATLPIAQYQSLYSLFGTMYGGDGRTTFNLPDLRGRMAIHIDNGVRQGTRSGSETVTLTTQNLPSHSHSIRTAASTSVPSPAGALPGTLPSNIQAFSTEVAPSGSHMASGMIKPNGGNQSVPIVAPSLAMKWCVTTQGLFPPRN